MIPPLPFFVGSIIDQFDARALQALRPMTAAEANLALAGAQDYEQQKNLLNCVGRAFFLFTLLDDIPSISLRHLSYVKK